MRKKYWVNVEDKKDAIDCEVSIAQLSHVVSENTALSFQEASEAYYRLTGYLLNGKVYSSGGTVHDASRDSAIDSD